MYVRMCGQYVYKLATVMDICIQPCWSLISAAKTKYLKNNQLNRPFLNEKRQLAKPEMLWQYQHTNRTREHNNAASKDHWLTESKTYVVFPSVTRS